MASPKLIETELQGAFPNALCALGLQFAGSSGVMPCPGQTTAPFPPLHSCLPFHASGLSPGGEISQSARVSSQQTGSRSLRGVFTRQCSANLMN